MAAQENGHVQQLPAITVGWDAEAHGPVVHFDAAQFKTYDFVIAVLQMATTQMEDKRKAVVIQNMREQATAQAQHEALRRGLNLG